MDEDDAVRVGVRVKVVVRWSPPPRTCPCPLCGSLDTRTTSSRGGGYRFHRCRACGARFQSCSKGGGV